jgi:hypothetical protein
MAPKTYVWSEDYEAAVLELDPQKIIARIDKAEATINERSSQLHRESGPCAEELQYMTQALRVLTILREISAK